MEKLCQKEDTMSFTSKTKLAILVSGTGSNMEAIIEAAKNPSYPGKVQVVISDKKDAPALQKARNHGIPTVVIDPKVFGSKTDYDQMLITTLKQYQIEFICLAGFMRLLSKTVVDTFPKKIINIHPSLLPNFPGVHPVRDALKASVKETGTTVHFVDEGIDTGPIISQVTVPVQKEDTEESLHERIKKEEHKLYPKVIEMVISQNKPT